MTDVARRLKRGASWLSGTPLHPQWLSARYNRELLAWLRALPGDATVLDIGSATQWPRSVLPAGCRYVGLDFPTTANWYGVKPALFADAHVLPLADRSVQVVLALDVLEHLRDPERALSEMRRVLSDDGQLVLQVPFLYPVHDAPHDHTRWTMHGHRALADRHGFDVHRESSLGEPVETAALLGNLALCRSALDGAAALRPSGLLLPVLPLLILVKNLAAWTLARLSPRSAYMPFSYRAVWTKRPHGVPRAAAA